MSFYRNFKKRFLEGDLLEALKAYDVWLYLTWLGDPKSAHSGETSDEVLSIIIRPAK